MIDLTIAKHSTYSVLLIFKTHQWLTSCDKTPTFTLDKSLYFRIGTDTSASWRLFLICSTIVENCTQEEILFIIKHSCFPWLSGSSDVSQLTCAFDNMHNTNAFPSSLMGLFRLFSLIMACFTEQL